MMNFCGRNKKRPARVFFWGGRQTKRPLLAFCVLLLAGFFFPGRELDAMIAGVWLSVIVPRVPNIVWNVLKSSALPRDVLGQVCTENTYHTHHWRMVLVIP
jgi:hypothetical protein